MSDSVDNTPPKDSEKRESVFKVLDDLISHMNTTRNVFVLLIASAFIIAPISLVMAAILLSPPTFVQTDVVRFVPVPANVAGGPLPSGGIVTAPGEPFDTIIIEPADRPPFVPGQRVDNLTVGPSSGTIFVTGETQGFKVATEKPRFIFIGGPPAVNQPADMTSIILIFIATSVILASIWLFIGVKEYRFFSKWNKRYGDYMSLQSQIEKRLEE
jgi:hypothetical protein